MAATSNARVCLNAIKGKPHSLRVTMREGEIRKLIVPDVKRWKTRVAATLDSMTWKSIEPIDAKENIVGPTVENAEADMAGEVEDLEVEDVGGVTTQLAGLLKILLHGQEMALKRQAQAYESVLGNNEKLLMVITNRLQAMEKHASGQFAEIAKLHRLTAGSEDDSDSEILGAVAQMIMQNQGQGKEVPK